MRSVGVLAALAGLILCSVSCFAQEPNAQAASLKGLKTVYVEVGGNSLSPERREAFSPMVNLELRKAGLRIAKDMQDLGPNDGALVVNFKQVDRALSQDLALEWLLFEPVTILRTGQKLALVTWRHVDDRRATQPAQVAEPMLRAATDKFLDAWLSANGR